MVLAKRIIPCLDVDHGRVVKGVHFRNLKRAGDPVELAKIYCTEGADELVFLDITASPEKRKILSGYVRRTASVLDIPFTVGGGVSKLEDARLILMSGADKVAVNTAAVRNPSLIERLSDQFGQQCIVVAIDAKRRYDKLDGKVTVSYNGKRCWYEVHIYGGSKPTGVDALQWVEEAEELGAGEILLTSIDADGTKDGYELTLTKEVAGRVNIPVIASGGCGKPEHFVEVFRKGMADAALAASIFHFREYSIPYLKQYLGERGISVRI